MDVKQRQDRATITETLKVPRRKKDIPDLFDKKKPEAKKLKKKLLDIVGANESLTNAINEKNSEIADLKRSVQSLNDVLNSVPIDELRCNSSIASTKILELSKKNRQVRAELETTKNRLNKKEMQIQKMEREMRSMEDKTHITCSDVTRKGTCEDMQSKVNALQQKLFESRNKISEMQTQLKLAQKCLQQEVGENFNLNLMANNSTQSNWRGRAQQILHLQQKVHELKERLDLHERHTGGRVSSYSCQMDILNSSGGDAPSVTSAPSVNDGLSTNSCDRFANGVRKTEIIHRAKVDKLEKEIASLKTQLEEGRSKILALKVRNKTLNDEVIKFKMKASTLEEQTDYNGINLATMNEKLNVQKYQFENRLEEINRQLSNVIRQREKAELKEEEMRGKVENLELVLKEKDDYIHEQTAIIKKLETDLKALCGDFLFSCREFRKEEFIAILDSLESEKNHLLQYNKTLNERIDQERVKNDTLCEQTSKQKIRAARLETKIRDLEKELDAQTERRKRSQRIADYANSISNTSVSTVSSFIFENTVNTAPPPNSTYANIEELKSPHVVELKNQLEFATEKIAMLEEKISHLAEEKDIDAKTFDSIMINSKTIIYDTIMNRKSAETTSFSDGDKE